MKRVQFTVFAAVLFSAWPTFADESDRIERRQVNLGLNNTSLRRLDSQWANQGGQASEFATAVQLYGSANPELWVPPGQSRMLASGGARGDSTRVREIPAAGVPQKRSPEFGDVEKMLKGRELSQSIQAVAVARTATVRRIENEIEDLKQRQPYNWQGHVRQKETELASAREVAGDARAEAGRLQRYRAIYKLAVERYNSDQALTPAERYLLSALREAKPNWDQIDSVFRAFLDRQVAFTLQTTGSGSGKGQSGAGEGR